LLACMRRRYCLLWLAIGFHAMLSTALAVCDVFY